MLMDLQQNHIWISNYFKFLLVILSWIIAMDGLLDLLIACLILWWGLLLERRLVSLIGNLLLGFR